MQAAVKGTHYTRENLDMSTIEHKDLDGKITNARGSLQILTEKKTKQRSTTLLPKQQNR